MTRSKATRSAAEISAARIAAASRLPRPRARERNDFHLIDDTVGPVTDPEVAAMIAELKAAREHEAGVQVGCEVMRFTGCDGEDCAQDGHAGHVGYGAELAMELGLMPDPLAKGTRTINGYATSPRKTRTGERE